jgi:hypothetical protein
MGRLLTGIGGALGLAWLWRFLRREQKAQRVEQPDPAAELRAKLEQAREAADDRDEFDAAEGQPLDEAELPLSLDQAEPPLSLDERRRAIHEKAQQALGEMNRPGGDE